MFNFLIKKVLKIFLRHNSYIKKKRETLLNAMLFESHLHKERGTRNQVSQTKDNGGPATKNVLCPQETQVYVTTVFRKTKRTQSSPQVASFERADVNGDAISFVLQRGKNRMYGSSKDARSFYEFFERIPPNERSLFTVDRSHDTDQHSLFYLDIEWYSAAPCEKAADRLDLLKRLISNGLEQIGLPKDRS